jgi:RecG-like helicase
MGALRRLLDKLGESDDARLAAEIRAWAESVPGTCRISDCPMREPVKIAGVVKRITVFPVQGKETLEALVTDGTGEMSVAFMGRRAIPGLGLGTRMIVEGVAGEQRGTRRMVNPRFEFTR